MRVLARVGMVARAAFYLLLAGLVVRVALEGGAHGKQANANGALSVVAADPVGMAAIAAAALGFFVLGAVRVAGAVRDRSAERSDRLVTAGKGLLYAAASWVPVSFLLGSRQTGSEQAQHEETARLLTWPGGRWLLGAIGLGILAACGWQMRSALRRDFTDGLDLRRAPAWVCRLVAVAGSVGLVARALVLGPVGALLVVVAVQADSRHAKGPDAELALLARQGWWGPALLAAVALGLAVFAAYAGLEARYRRIDRGA
jgi:hypothetical protein